MKGKLVAITSNLNRQKIKQYEELTTKLKQLEQRHKHHIDGEVQHHIKEICQKINDLLHYEVELKARYLKQNYYESGPKSAKFSKKTKEAESGNNDNRNL